MRTPFNGKMAFFAAISLHTLIVMSEFVTFYASNWMKPPKQTIIFLLGYMYRLTSKSLLFSSLSTHFAIQSPMFRSWLHEMVPSGSEVVIYVRINWSCTVSTTHFSFNHFEFPILASCQNISFTLSCCRRDHSNWM